MAQAPSSMVLKKTCTEFHKFQSLPPEIRQEIWKESLVLWYNTPRVCIFDAYKLAPDGELYAMCSLPGAPPVPEKIPGADMKPPAALFVNVESRLAAFRFGVSKLPVGASEEDVWCRFIWRNINPEIDIFYPRICQSDVTCELLNREVMKQCRHLAIDFVNSAKFGPCDYFRRNNTGGPQMPRLRTVSIVLPATRNDFVDDYKPPHPTRAEARLESLGPEALGRARDIAGKQELLPKDGVTWLDERFAQGREGVLFPKRGPEYQFRFESKFGLFTGFESPALKLEACLLTEPRRSPSGESRYVVIGEENGGLTTRSMLQD